ncbi:MAG TPA: tetratricopeptide repeat protein [Longimicrobium sp.]|jgi:hypothetical protein|uniref:tetratricopeptide repeat protein n=1 Tax=Longimicrobium sp. TaxID=2029185 RepID=UPI002EDB7554
MPFSGYLFSPYSLVILLIQVFFAVHAVRSGKFYWLFIIFFFPLIGSIVYFVVEYLPEMRSGRTGLAKVGTSVKRVLDPGAEIRRLEDQVSLADTHDNRVALGRAYRQAGRLEDAIRTYESSLSGIHADSPKALTELGSAYFEAGRIADARSAYDRLRSVRVLTPDELVLSGRVHEAGGDLPAALRDYTAAAPGGGSAEARCRQALLLKLMGRGDEAKRVFDEVLRHARISSPQYRREQKEWIELAKRETA